MKKKSYRFFINTDYSERLEVETYPVTLRKFFKMLQGMLKITFNDGEKNVNIRIEVVEDD